MLLAEHLLVHEEDGPRLPGTLEVVVGLTPAGAAAYSGPHLMADVTALEGRSPAGVTGCGKVYSYLHTQQPYEAVTVLLVTVPAGLDIVANRMCGGGWTSQLSCWPEAELKHN